MDWLTQVVLLLTIGPVAVYSQKTKHGFTDEDRPYEFGFDIQGYQHRHEKKDERGIIMGEFGFITADGIYHVTVYATDENGDFKILKMKNIKVGFPPGSALKSMTPKAAPSIAPLTTKPAIPPAIGPGVFSNTPKPVFTAPGSALKSMTPKAAPSIAPLTTKPATPPAIGPGVFSNTPKPTSAPGTYSSPVIPSTTLKVQVNDGCGSCKVPVSTTKKPFSSTAGQQGSNPPKAGIFGTPRPTLGSSSRPPFPGGQLSPPGGAQPPVGSIFGTLRPPSGGVPYPGGTSPSTDGILGTSSPPAGTVGGKLSHPGGAQPPVVGIFSTSHPPSQGPPSPAVTSPPTDGFFGTPRIPDGLLGGTLTSPGGAQPPGGGIFSTSRPPSGVSLEGTLPPSSSTGSFGGSFAPPGNAQPPAGDIFKTPRPTAGPFGGSSPAQPEKLPSGFSRTPHPPNGTLGGTPGGTQRPPVDNIGGQLAPPGGNFSGKPPDSGEVPLGVERPGLPNGITKADIMKLLYRFNYTVGFHGHHEEGYRNGDKIGAYFVNGRDGISTQVKYIANEFGYQPNITFIPLGLDSPDTPKKDTEKNFGLKGYAFEWFYRR